MTTGTKTLKMLKGSKMNKSYESSKIKGQKTEKMLKVTKDFVTEKSFPKIKMIKFLSQRN